MGDISNLTMAMPKYATDKILGVYTGTLSIAAPTVGQQNLYTEVTIQTGFNDSVLTQAIYSTDNGVTWNDDNQSIPNLIPASFALQTLDVTSFSGTNIVGLATENWYNSSSHTGTPYTILYKIFALAKSNQGVLTPTATNYKLSYTSIDNYLKIVPGLDNSVSETIATSGTTTFNSPHNLGYVPTSRAYVEYSNGRIWPATRNQYPGTAFGTNNNQIETSIQIDTTSTNYVMTNTGATASFNLHYRTYVGQ